MNDNNLGVIVLIILLLIAVAIVIAIAQSPKKNTETAKHTNYTSIYNQPASEPSAKAEPIISCKNCGQTLPSDSEVYYICGTKIHKEENA